MYPILIVTSTSPMHILDQGRTITAPVDYEGILKMEGASCLPAAAAAAAAAVPVTAPVQAAAAAAVALVPAAAAIAWEVEEEA
jgi:hydroxyethylthiazole kinase-like sugar kinase family protein